MNLAGETVCVGLGANLGDAQASLAAAIQALGAIADTELLRVSGLYRSAPVDAHGPDFFNAAAELRTALEPEDFLDALQAIEQAAGRERPYRNAPRTLDLDILLWGHARIATPRLTVPHPRLWERAFVLLPLADLYPDRYSGEPLQAVQGQRIERVLDKNGKKAHQASANSYKINSIHEFCPPPTGCPAQ